MTKPPSSPRHPRGKRRRSRSQSARYYYLQQQLKKLGFTSYDAYLQSEHWAEVRRRYRASRLPQHCISCGATPFILCHRTYEHIGKETLGDLDPLCNECHKLGHQLLRMRAEGITLWNVSRELSRFRGKPLDQIKRKTLEHFPSTVLSPATRPVQPMVEPRPQRTRRRGKRAGQLGPIPPPEGIDFYGFFGVSKRPT